MSKKIIVLVCYLLCNLLTNKLVAQTRIIDSLRKALNTNISNKSKQQISFKMCEQYYSLSADSLQQYVTILAYLFRQKIQKHIFNLKISTCFLRFENWGMHRNPFCIQTVCFVNLDTKKNWALRLAITI